MCLGTTNPAREATGLPAILAFLPCCVVGVGIDGGNDKDWEANAGKITLIKKKGKVKALDEEVNSKSRFPPFHFGGCIKKGPDIADGPSDSAAHIVQLIDLI